MDTRERAVRCLAGQVRPNDRVLVLRELAFLPSRLDTLPAKVQVRVWERARDRVIEHRDHYLVLGEVMRPDGKPKIRPMIVNWILANYQIVAQFGSSATSHYPGFFRGNAQIIYVLKRKPEALTPPPEEPGSPPAPPREAAQKSSAP